MTRPWGLDCTNGEYIKVDTSKPDGFGTGTPTGTPGPQGDPGPQGEPGDISAAWPVGAVFISVVSTSPATLLGFGTWSAFAAGRVLVGLDTGQTEFDTVEETGGAKTVAAVGSNSAPTISGSTATEAAHTHTYTQVPNHVHGVSTILRTSTTGAATTQVTNTADTSSTADTTRKTDNPDGGVATGTTAAGSAHGHAAGTLAASAPTFTGSPTSVLQPYITVYMWKRTA